MKFCFLGNVDDALRGKTPGGGELQVTLLAKALALGGHEVIIVDPLASESFTTKEGIQLLHVPEWNKGVKGIRLFKNRIPALKKILIEQKADYYYVRMRSYLNFIGYQACKKTNGKFIVGIACDLDVQGFWKKFVYEYKPKFNLFQFLTLSLPNDIVFKHLLKKSDYITIQHADQKLSLGNTKSRVRIYPNIFDQSVPVIDRPAKDYFIYVGSLTMLKGADNLYKLIESLDKKHTIMIVGQPRDPQAKKIYQQLGKFENIILKGGVPHRETIQLIANAKALISTSNFEGFPNVFLEAWATGVPVISLKIDPGNVINKYGLGVCCEGNLEKFKKYMESGELCSIDKSKLKAYVSEFHDFNRAAERFLDIIER